MAHYVATAITPFGIGNIIIIILHINKVIIIANITFNNITLILALALVIIGICIGHCYGLVGGHAPRSLLALPLAMATSLALYRHIGIVGWFVTTHYAITAPLLAIGYYAVINTLAAYCIAHSHCCAGELALVIQSLVGRVAVVGSYVIAIACHYYATYAAIGLRLRGTLRHWLRTYIIII